MSSQWPLLLASFAIALVLSIPFLAFQVLQLRRMSRVKPFPFLRLPPELRNIVYEHLIEQDPWYSPTSSTAKAAPAFDWPLRRKQPSIKKNAIMFTSRQVYDEFTDVLCKKATFILTVDQDSKDNRSLWPIRPDTLKKIRRCDLRIKIGSGMLGALDPRSVPKEWPIREQIWKTLKGMEKTEDLRLHIQAIGDPLWNPVSANQRVGSVPADGPLVMAVVSYCPSIPGIWRAGVPKHHVQLGIMGVISEPSRAEERGRLGVEMYRRSCHCK